MKKSKSKAAIKQAETEQREEQARRFATRLLSSGKFQAELQKRLDDMTIHPSVLNTLLYYQFGRPKEIIEATKATPVRIQHQYADETEPKVDDANDTLH